MRFQLLSGPQPLTLVSFHKFPHLVEYNEVGNKSSFCFFIAKARTFESICGSRSKVLVRVKFQGQLPVGLLQIFIAGTFVHTENLIKVLTILYPTKGEKNLDHFFLLLHICSVLSKT